MDEKLILNDGTELTGHLIETETRLFLYIYNLSLEEVFDLLKVVDNTKVIKWEQYGNRGTVRGYKKLMSISVEQDLISASLKK